MQTSKTYNKSDDSDRPKKSFSKWMQKQKDRRIHALKEKNNRRKRSLMKDGLSEQQSIILRAQ